MAFVRDPSFTVANCCREVQPETLGCNLCHTGRADQLAEVSAKA